jgi:hypothetical protein
MCVHVSRVAGAGLGMVVLGKGWSNMCGAGHGTVMYRMTCSWLQLCFRSPSPACSPLGDAQGMGMPCTSRRGGRQERDCGKQDDTLCCRCRMYCCCVTAAMS